MITVRLIARLDIKAPNLIKGVHLEGLRVMGNPQEFAQRYYEAGVDELLYMDIVASLYNRNNLTHIIEHTVQNVFVPITVGGGVRSVQDVKTLLRSGADKVAINTAAIREPQLITEVARQFGSQCMVLSIEAKQVAENKWEAYTDNGRERTGLDVVEWAKKGVELGAGEILLTSVDREGTRKGFDLKLTESVSEVVSVPIIASGGMGKIEDMIEVIEKGKVTGVAMADVLHYNRLNLREIREVALAKNIPVRKLQ